MVRDLVVNVLPGREKREIERLLGPSPSHDQMRRYTQSDLQTRVKDEEGNWLPFPRTGQGYYWDEFQWDLIYEIGLEEVSVLEDVDHAYSPDPEVLIIRLDDDGVLSSWYIAGETRWQRILGEKAMARYKETR
jgi:hypothetical protein